MVKNVCETYLKGLKDFHFKLFLALALASGATRPCLGVSEHPPNPQFQWLKIDLCGYRRSNYFSRSAPDRLLFKQVSKQTTNNSIKLKFWFQLVCTEVFGEDTGNRPSSVHDNRTILQAVVGSFSIVYSKKNKSNTENIGLQIRYWVKFCHSHRTRGNWVRLLGAKYQIAQTNCYVF